MVKLQQYFIMKIPTSFLKRKKYTANLSIDMARRSGFMVSIGDSQMLRSLRKVKGQTHDSNYITQLMVEQKKIKKKKSSMENSQRIREISNELDSILFIEDIVSVVVDDTRHYEYIGKNGFVLNGKRFIRFICGAGQARRNNALFISEQYENQLYHILNNGRDENVPITPAKFSAYFGLASSSSIQVTTPRFCVVPDYVTKRTELVDYIEEVQDGDDLVYEAEKEIEFNLWDGQGIISPEFAKQWAKDLDLDYLPSAYIIRANFIKGMVCVMDFHKFAYEHGKNHITDIYGNIVYIGNVDVILTQSQFKLWETYVSLEQYNNNCRKNDLSWGITRVTPKIENKYCFLNYQFIQVLNLNNDQIKSLCHKTIDYFNDIINNKIETTLIYLLGKLTNVVDANIFEKLHDNVAKALILNNELIKDPYVKNHIIKTLNKKIRDSYIGNLIIDGQYTMMISDPMAFLEYIFELPIRGLLQRGEHYNHYWVDRGEKRIAAMRAPLTYRSEVNILNLKDNDDIREWYQYITIGTIYNIFGNDTLLHADNDWDGDLHCVTNSKEIIDGAYGGLPIHYNTKKASKEIIDKNILYQYDIKSFNQKIGFVTNCATSAFGQLQQFSENTPEYIELVKRLKRFRKEQGSNIDATKGLIIKPFPSHWTKWKRINQNMSGSTIQQLEFENRIVINKRPLFMRYLYSAYNKKYNDFVDRFNTRAIVRFNKTIQEILNTNEILLSADEILLKKAYHKYNPFIESSYIMNDLSKYMEYSIRQIRLDAIKDSVENNVELLRNNKVKTTKEDIKKLYDLYLEYRKEKRNFSSILDVDGAQKYKTIEQYNKSIKERAYDMISNGTELVNIAIDICYVVHPNDPKTFVWNVFGEELIENIKTNKQEDCFVPFIDEYGHIIFLGERYSNYIISIKEADEANI